MAGAFGPGRAGFARPPPPRGTLALLPGLGGFAAPFGGGGGVRPEGPNMAGAEGPRRAGSARPPPPPPRGAGASARPGHDPPPPSRPTGSEAGLWYFAVQSRKSPGPRPPGPGGTTALPRAEAEGQPRPFVRDARRPRRTLCKQSLNNGVSPVPSLARGTTHW